MALVIPSAGKATIFKLALNNQTQADAVLKLYTNDVTPVITDTEATYTEASGSGYAAVTLTGATWSVTSSVPIVASYTQQTFTFTGSLGNVYGYFITLTGTNEILWSERFVNGPYNIANSGDKIRFTPTITFTDV